MSEHILTTKQLAERWECNEQAIRDRVNSGKLKPLKNLPANRFSVSYIEEIEQSQCDPLSPVEKRRLLNKIEGLEKELEYSKNVLISIDNLAAMKGVWKW